MVACPFSRTDVLDLPRSESSALRAGTARRPLVLVLNAGPTVRTRLLLDDIRQPSGIVLSAAEGVRMDMTREVRRTIKRLLARHHGTYRWTRRACMFGKYLCGRPHEADFKAFRHFAHRNGLFLDIGANSGESILSFRLFNPTAPILSIEPNPYHEPDLRFLKQRIDKFDYLLCAAGERSGSATLYVPVYKGLPLTGEASFHLEQAINNYWMQEQIGPAASNAVRLTELQVDVKRMDDLSLRPAFVKIDVQGFEASVVAGLRSTIAACQPVLLVERSGCDAALCRQLGDLGYTAFVYHPRPDGFARYDGEAVQNLFFVPRQRAEPELPVLNRPDDRDG